MVSSIRRFLVSGFLASTGKFSLWGVVAIITLANTVGSVILFVVGASGGRWILEKYGKYILIHKRELERADEWFRKHGGAAIFWSRLLPAIRSIISLPAGVARMNFLKFTLFTAAGSLPWNFVLAYLGYKAGQNWESLKPYFEKLNSLVFGVLVLAAVWYLRKHLSDHKKEKAA